MGGSNTYPGLYRNTATQRLPYQQGAIVASNWNVQIKYATHDRYSLDNLMRAILLYSKTHGKLTSHMLNNIALPYTNKEIIGDVKKIYSGKLLIPAANALGPCIYQRNKFIPPFKKPIIQFELNQAKWKNQPEGCLAWFRH